MKPQLVSKQLNFFEKERRIMTCEKMLSYYQSVMKLMIKTNDDPSEYHAKGKPNQKYRAKVNQKSG